MSEKRVLVADEIPFDAVAWGRSKVLVGAGINGALHLRVGVTEYDPDTPHAPHRHAGQEEVIWVLSGRGYSASGAERMALFPGAVAYIPAGVEHATVAVGEPMTAIIIKGPAADANGVES